MFRKHLFPQTSTVLICLLSVCLLGQPTLVEAGCGCTKAPPVPAAVRPHATYAGTEVTLFHPDLQTGQGYDVTFTSGISGESASVSSQAVTRRDLADGVEKAQVVVPVPALPLGPTSLSVTAAGQIDALMVADDAVLTVVPQPVVLSSEVGEMVLPDFQAAVSRDGTVYVSLDVSGIGMPRTFQAQALGYPLRFTNDEVIFYNVQGFVMQLLAEGMPGLFAIDTMASMDSDLLQYSRHEFNTYFLQHAEQLPHAVDPTDANWHEEGTPHIDHDHLVVAIGGFLSDGSLPVPGATPPFDLVLSAYTLFQHGLVGDVTVEVRQDSHINSYDTQTGNLGAQGDVLSNGLVRVRGGSLVEGDVTATTFDISGNSSVTGDMNPVTTPIEFLPVGLPTALEDLGAIVLTTGMAQTLGPGSYRVDQVNVAGAGSQLFIDNTTGPVTLYATGHVTNDGMIRAVKVADFGSILVADPDPEKFAIYVAAGEVIIKNGGAFAGVIYAPHSSVTIRAGTFVGSFVGREVIVVEGATVHYDTALRGQAASSGCETPSTGPSETPTSSTGGDSLTSTDTTPSADTPPPSGDPGKGKGKK